MVRKLVILTCLIFSPVAAFAQTGIAGVVRDTTGAVLPGVTVEASSPALIEKVRTVVTDDQGQYRIIDLRPGVYTVTFSLAGFTTVRREGIELTTNFTAAVSAELRVGTLEETVTVTGQSPVVDVQNIIQRQVVTDELIDALPTARNFTTLGTLIPGLIVSTANRPAAQDVGGLAGERGTIRIHGARGDSSIYLEGLPVIPNAAVFTINTGEAEEFNYELGAIAADVATGGVRLNVVPKTGSNLFRGTVFGNYTNGSLQKGNLTDDLRARGVQAGNPLKKIWDLNPSVGGPIKQDKLWFFGSFRYWGLQDYVAGSYYDTNPDDFVHTPDLSRQHLDDKWITATGLRLTTQVTPRNKLNAYATYEDQCQCHWQGAGGFTGNVRPEASVWLRYTSIRLAQASWSSPVTNRLLLEAAALASRTDYMRAFQPEALGRFAIIDLSTNTLFGANTEQWRRKFHSDNVRAAVNYVTGSHAFKGGMTFSKQDEYSLTEVNGDMWLRSLNGLPNSVIVHTTPRVVEADLRALGLYAQDQWTIKRLTLNLGVRFDYQNNSIPELHLAPVRFVGARDFAAVRDVPNWTDLSPRLGAAYDLFGTGKTALKVTLSRYLEGGSSITNNVNPVNTSVNSATRAWTDLNGDFFPQENELGPLSDPGFGQVRIRTRFDDDLREGFGKRGFNWETSASLQHELLPQVSVNAGYFRRWFGNDTVTDNLLNTAADYDPFCITAPVDTRLPGGGGNQICGLFDINPAKRATDNLVTFADNYGKQTEVYDGVDLTANVRLPRGALVSGGFNVGRTALDKCDVLGKVDNPAVGGGTNLASVTPVFPASPSLRFCRQDQQFRPSVKFLGTVELPWGIQAAATFQNQQGPMIVASYVASNNDARATLGRNLTLGTSIVDLIEPGTQFEKRFTQVDLRLGKTVGVGRTRIKGMLDLYNLFNASPVLVLNTRYGPEWLKPVYIMPGRLLKLGAQVDF